MPTADTTDPAGLRTADLIGATLVDAGGTPLGRITDLGLAEAELPGGIPGLRVTGVVATSGRLARLLCLDHRPVDRPAPLAALARWMTRRASWIAWPDVALVTPGGDGHPGTVHLRPGAVPTALHTAGVPTATGPGTR
ncbi:hypothetical protein ACIA8O_36210 [Kitasatospora sp. NPDC051853]|uniref:hypothetical protein n=1 Tax=Kitasatospora sp. NPDC051853 TaxID=3364058 RepID=UPI003793AA2A